MINVLILLFHTILRKHFILCNKCIKLPPSHKCKGGIVRIIQYNSNIEKSNNNKKEKLLTHYARSFRGIPYPPPPGCVVPHPPLLFPSPHPPPPRPVVSPSPLLFP